MSQPHELKLLCNELESKFQGEIIGEGTNEGAKKSNFLTKALCAYFLHAYADADIHQAAKSIVDGREDNGIDAIFIDSDNIIWLLQSKYIKNGNQEPDLGDVTKFTKNGVIDLLDMRFERFATISSQLRSQIEHALDQPDVQVKGVLVHTGNVLHEDRTRQFADIEKDYNDDTRPEYIKFHDFGLQKMINLFLQQRNQVEINESNIVLENFGKKTQPYIAYYGVMDAKDLCVVGRRYGEQLVDRNIRVYKGSTKVNKEIEYTLLNDTNNFFYFNNGITFLCTDIREKPPVSRNRKKGVFDVKGLSVINGAQTVGTIASKKESYYQGKNIKVLVTFIKLDDLNSSVSQKITEYRNLQNNVDLKDFSSLDEKQQRWSEILNISGLNYIIKSSSENIALTDTVLTLKEVARYLACFYTGGNFPNFIIAANSSVDKLLKSPLSKKRRREDDPLKNAYDDLFHDSLRSSELWKLGQVGQITLKIIKDRALTENNLIDNQELSSRSILEEGKFMILHLVYIQIKSQLNLATPFLSSDEQTKISQQIDVIAEKLVQVINTETWDKRASSIFTNLSDCRRIKGLMMAALVATETTLEGV
ncbi:AIPR family protein [Ignatzschineria sp. LJL83]